MRPNTTKQKFFESLKIPDNIKELHSLVGVFNYYRSFVPNYSDKMKYLFDVINRKKVFNRLNIEKKVIEIKEYLDGKIYLKIPNMERNFIIEVDASNLGIGGVLKQLHEDQELIVKHVSRTLNAAEKNYSTIEKELLSIIFTLKEFKHYLFKPFVLRTDYKPLTYLKGVKNPSDRLSRWLLFLDQFSFSIEYIQGSKNSMADHLSRNHEIMSMEMEMVDFSKIIKEAHVMTGHSAANATFNFIKKQYNLIPKFKQVVDFIGRCEICLSYDKNKKFKINPIIKEIPFELIGIDLIGPLKRTNNGNRFIVLITDYATNWVEGKSLKNKSTKGVAKFLLQDVFTKHGPPKEIRADMEKEFTSDLIKSLAKEWNVKMKYSAPYAPYSNGKAERSNRILINKILKLIEFSEDWDDILPYALFSYRITPIDKFKRSPFELIYGRLPYINNTEIHKMFINNFERVREENRQSIAIKNLKYEETINNRNFKLSEKNDLLLGETVFYLNRKRDSKFERRWIGPFTVQELCENGTVLIKSIETGLLIKLQEWILRNSTQFQMKNQNLYYL